MSIEIKHPFVSAKGDGGDATLVRPSNWNANHNTSMATGNLLGRTTSGAGSFEEIPLSAYIAAALNAADADALLALLGFGGFETGDVKYSIDPVAASGWITLSSPTGTIGETGSAATLRANDDTLALYTLVYNNISDTYCPVSGGRSGVAATDFAAGKLLTLPPFPGRTIIGAGSAGASTSARTLGVYSGYETHTLTTAELAVHSHANSLTDPGHTHGLPGINAGGVYSSNGNNAGTPYYYQAGTYIYSASATTGISITNANAGSGSAHNNMQPFIPLHAKVKL